MIEMPKVLTAIMDEDLFTREYDPEYDYYDEDMKTRHIKYTLTNPNDQDIYSFLQMLQRKYKLSPQEYSSIEKHLLEEAGII